MKYLITIVFSFLTVKSIAQIITDRPDQTEASSTVGAGDLQIESGTLISFEGNGNFSTQQILAPTNLFRYGFTDAIELRFLSQYEILKNNSQKVQGISDLELGTKIQLFKSSESSLEIAIISHLLIPVGTKELTTSKFATINKLAISRKLSENKSLGLNLGYNYFGVGKGNLTYSLALGVEVNKKAGVYIEPYGEVINIERGILNFDAGFTYLVNKNLQLDFSFGVGVTERMNYISIGASWLLPHN